ncbi:MAG: amino acid adenylation domain-containing protein [Clostridium sp.]|nr:amino acid adenylation domain-containing protein [Clostridium sp.]
MSDINKLNTQDTDKLFWNKQLSANLSDNHFPYDYNYEGNNEEKIYEWCELNLSDEANNVIKKVAGSSDVKLHILFISALSILISRYSENNDIIISSPIYKQNIEGNFENKVLVFRNEIDLEGSFKNFLLKVKDNLVEATKHQNFPISKFINTIEFENFENGNDIFQVMLAIDAIHDINYVDCINSNLYFLVVNDEKNIKIKVKFNSNLYKKESIKLILYSLEELITELISKNSIENFNILSNYEKTKILNEFNKKTVCDEEYLLHELFEKQVEKNPDEIALIDGSRSITYKELNDKANSLAGFINEKGMGKNTIIGVMLDNSIELIISLLGILKAGAAYLPIDSGYPEDRISFMIEDSKLNCIITENKYENLLKDRKINIIDINNEEIYLYKDRVINIEKNPSTLAYIIYTSGTTGKPKGVMIEHKAVTKSILWRSNEYKLSVEDAVLQLFSYSFDGFVTSFFTPIVSGSKVVLLKGNEVKNPYKINEAIKKYNVTHFIAVPPLFKAILDNAKYDDLLSLKIVTLAGDNITNDVIKKAKQLNENLEIVNEYGPTENSVVTTIYRDLKVNEPIKIGKPISNTQVYIIKNDKLCNVGISGELCISGERLARGYLNREDLTSERFVQNPFDKDLIMYKTGDIGKWDIDGNIRLLGRKDNQVKIRGFRIELGEVENRILEYKGIESVVVTAKYDHHNNKSLCAYFVSKDKVSTLDLRQYLNKVCPLYMVPAYFMQIDSIPITVNGKVDRKNLPDIEFKRDINSKFVEPRNENEKIIANEWRKVLEIDQIGIYDNFFNLGGDSLKAIQVASLLSDKFEIEINDIYKNQTIAELAEKIKYSNTSVKDRIKQIINSDYTFNDDKNLSEQEYINDEYNNKLNLCKEESYTVKSYTNIMLTGVTGYVGAYLSKEILETLNSNIYVLVRGEDLNIATKRYIDKLTFYFGEDFYNKYKDRISVINGDITEEFLGIEKCHYDELANTIDCVINSAAYVKHFGEYKNFYDINIKGVNNLMKFANSGVKKDFNQISTLSIASGTIPEKDEIVFTELDCDVGQENENFYSMSKLEGEKKILEASKEYSINTKIFRLGNIVCNSESGKFQENISENAFYNFVKSLIKLKTIANIDLKVLDFTFVDQAAKAILKIFDKENLEMNIFHISNNNKVSLSELGNMLKEIYKDINVCDAKEFLNILYDNLDNEELAPYVNNILRYFGLLDDKHITKFIILNSYTDLLLKKNKFEWSKLNIVKLKSMIDYCVNSKFI